MITVHQPVSGDGSSSVWKPGGSGEGYSKESNTFCFCRLATLREN